MVKTLTLLPLGYGHQRLEETPNLAKTKEEEKKFEISSPLQIPLYPFFKFRKTSSIPVI